MPTLPNESPNHVTGSRSERIVYYVSVGVGLLLMIAVLLAV